MHLFSQKASKVYTFDVPVFAYHRFGDDRYPSTNISKSDFEKQLKYLKQNAFDVITLGEAIRKWNNGEVFKVKSVILTVDDGYLSFYTVAMPLLKKYGYKATIFIQTGTVGGGDFMNWDQILEIERSGIEIGNHSDGHNYFVNLKDGALVETFVLDLEKSARIFKGHLGSIPSLYAYPYGEYTKDMTDAVKGAGYSAAVVQKSGVLCEMTNPYEIPRFPMGGPFATLEGFKNKSGMKALRIVKTDPDSPFPKSNPPALKVEIEPDSINLKQLQFFVAGTAVDIGPVYYMEDMRFVVLQSPERLKSRRTLYTITVPSLDGKAWHWYSYLWIRPEIKE
nr:polysaccharide deacetylase family protein [Bacteroidota bacterium]